MVVPRPRLVYRGGSGDDLQRHSDTEASLLPPVEASRMGNPLGTLTQPCRKDAVLTGGQAENNR